MEETLKLQDFITIPSVNEAVENKTMTQQEAVKYVTNTTAGEYFSNLYDNSSDDTSDDSSEDIVVSSDDSDDSQNEPVLPDESTVDNDSEDRGIDVTDGNPTENTIRDTDTANEFIG